MVFESRYHHNAVFLGFDTGGVARYMERDDALTAQRKELRNRLRREQRKPDQTEAPEIQAQISEIAKQLKQLRREISLPTVF